VIASLGLAERHVHARATRCALDCAGVTVSLTNGEQIRAQNVVIAIGSMAAIFAFEALYLGRIRGKEAPDHAHSHS